MAANRGDFKYEITEQLGLISDSGRSWRKEFNRISWNGGEPKYDIRDWSENHERMGKGVTLTEAEMRNLRELLETEIARLEEEK
jgi:hypothetical protein